MTFRAFSIGFSSALLALACGSDDNGGNTDEDVDPPIVVPVRETCAENPLLANCPVPGATATPTGPAPAPVTTTPAAGGPAPNELELQRAAALNVLEANCGQCHAGSLQPNEVRGNMNYIDDIDALVTNNKIVPENSAGSLIIKRMLDGSMPPAFSNLPKVTQADINTVATFIDNPLQWRTAAPSVVCDNAPVDFDDLYAAVADDLASLDADDALTARYISISNRFTAGVCGDTALDRDRQALTKMLNALSTETTVTAPVAVDRDQLIYRIDIGDYGWDQPVTVVINGIATDFVDKWEAIVANNPYAVPFVGEDADDAVQDSGTTVPVMFADSMLDVAIIGNLYYALVDVDVNQTLDDFILNDLGIDVVANLADEEQLRAGTTRSRISRQDRVVQRDDIEVRAGVLWQSFDFLAVDQNESIFEDPFGFAEGGTEAIFTLPNGMFAFVIANQDGLIVEDSDILLDTSQDNFRVVTSASCSGCHSNGLIPVEDEVREVAIANARVSGLNRDEVEQLEAIYAPPAEFARQIEDDTTGFYRSALTRLSLPVSGTDPVSAAFIQFDEDVNLATAAGDLGLGAVELRDNLQLLDPAVNILSRSNIDRDDFTAFYVDSLCQLSLVLENQPDVAVCDAAAAAILDL